MRAQYASLATRHVICSRRTTYFLAQLCCRAMLPPPVVRQSAISEVAFHSPEGRAEAKALGLDPEQTYHFYRTTEACGSNSVYFLVDRVTGVEWRFPTRPPVEYVTG